MNDIILDQSDNISGINQIEVIPFMHVTAIPGALDGIVDESGISLTVGRSFSVIEFQRNSAQDSIEQTETDGGDLFKYTLKARVPKEKTVLSTIIDTCTKPQILKVTDNNGIKKLIGSLRNPAKCKYTILKAGNPSGFNGYELTFSWQSLENPYYLE